MKAMKEMKMKAVLLAISLNSVKAFSAVPSCDDPSGLLKYPEGQMCGTLYEPYNVCSYSCDVGWEGLPPCKCASCGCTMECCSNEPPEPIPTPTPTPDNECNGVMYPADPKACFTTYLENNVCSRGCDDASWAGLPPCKCASCGCTMECCSN